MVCLQNYVKMISNETYSPLAVFKLVFSLSILVLFGCGETAKEAKTMEVKPQMETIEVTESNSEQVILCFGNSLTEGYGVKQKEAWPALLQEKVDSNGYNYQVVNAGISGETTSGGKNRLSWVLKENVKVFILELGPNDGLRGIPLTETKANLQEIIDTVKAQIPSAKIVLAGMQIPPNIGIEYTQEFKEIFPALADSNNVNLIPFLLEGVAGDPELNQKDGIHPTPEGYKIVINNVWNVVEPLLEK